MLISFYEDNLTTTFLRNILSTTPLPIYPCVCDGDYVHQGLVYIYKQRVIRCTKSGVIYITQPTLQIGRYYNSYQQFGSKDVEYANIEIIQRFDFGSYYTNITEKISLENSFYDQETHKALGKYLDCLQTCYRINLKHMYNCYNGTIFDDIYINPKITGD